MRSFTALMAGFPTLALAEEGKWSQLPPIPELRGVAAPFSGVSGGALLAAGGANFPDKMPWEGGKKIWLDTVWILEKPAGLWSVAGRLPRPLAYGVSVTAGGRVLCIGGSDAERHYDDVIQLIWQDGKLRVDSSGTPAALPIPLANAAGATDEKGNIYVACGRTEPGEQKASNRVFQAHGSANGGRWRELPPLPSEPRILPVAAASGEAFYVFGGAALELKDGKVARRYLTDAWRYTEKEGWQRLADLPRPCVAAASPAPVSGGAVWLMGGDDGSLAGFSPPDQHPGFPGAILRYDLAGNAWSAAGQAPAPRVTLPCAEWEGAFIFPSGEVRPGVRSPEVWSWRPAAGEAPQPGGAGHE